MASHVSSRVRHRHTAGSTVRAGVLALGVAAAGLGAAGCDRGGDDGTPEALDQIPIRSPEPGEGPRRVDLKGGVPGRDEGGPTPACLAFCEKSNRCAEEDGRPLPPGTRPCATACSPGGLYRLAPPAALACSDRPCGAFHACAERALLAAARASDIPVFPRKCVGLCNKLDWCADRLGDPIAAADDCELACGEGGLLASVPRAAHGCVDAPCGGEMVRCLAEGGTPAPLIARIFQGVGGGDGPSPDDGDADGPVEP